MSKMKWDQMGQKTYETGVSKCALFVKDDDGNYGTGVAWSGVTGVSESPSGAEPQNIYADNIKYLSLMSTEEFGATITAYTYPEEFEQCDGSGELVEGVTVGQQERKEFGLVYQTILGNDSKKNSYGKKLHIVYNCLAKPSSMDYKTVNDSPEAIEMSYELSTTPVEVTGMQPTATVTVDSTKIDAAKFAALEAYIYGSDTAEPKLPTPDQVKQIISTGSVVAG